MSTEAIRKACWNACVPICFRLAAKDVASPEAPVPLYLMCSRLSYLPLLFDKLKSHFLGVAPAALDEMWLEHETLGPLKWHLPVGVLYDLCGAGPTPWVVTVNFTAFPEDRIMRLSGLETLKTMFMSSLKEANYLKHGDGSLVMNLSRKDQDNLWLSIINGDAGYAAFWTASEKLMTPPEQLKSCAVRVFWPDGEAMFAQMVVKPKQADGSKTTLAQVMQMFGAASKGLAPIIQGVPVPLEATMWDLQTTVTHGDGWIYIVLRPARVPVQ